MPVTEYIWDVENDSYLMETDEAGTTTATYTNEPAPFGGLVSQHRGGATHYFHFDALGSTRALTDAAEAVTDTYLYDAWGVLLDRTGATKSPFQYMGELTNYFDKLTSQLYIRARHYSPNISRWTAPDRLAPRIELYAYVFTDNNPINKTDPTGRTTKISFRPPLKSHPWEDQKLGFFLGVTNNRWRITCTCDCRIIIQQGPGLPSPGGVIGVKTEWVVNCEIDVWSRIRLDLDEIKKAGVSVSGVYAHEQCHVKCFRTLAMSFVQSLNPKTFPASRKQDCESAASNRKGIIDAYFQLINGLGMIHSNPCSPGPSENDKSPIGIMPPPES